MLIILPQQRMHATAWCRIRLCATQPILYPMFSKYTIGNSMNYMRFIVQCATIAFIALNFSACKEESSSFNPTLLSGQTLQGSFNVTFKKYQNFSTALTQTGDIWWTFADSDTYHYLAKSNVSIWNNDTAVTIYDTLSDGGRYTYFGHYMTMQDGAWYRMDPFWHNSLYLKDTFTVNNVDNEIEISREDDFAKWIIELRQP